MKSFTYNDMAFSLEQAAERWNILCQRADGKSACVATGVFADVPENEVEARALALVKAAFGELLKAVAQHAAANFEHLRRSQVVIQLNRRRLVLTRRDLRVERRG